MDNGATRSQFSRKEDPLLSDPLQAHLSSDAYPFKDSGRLAAYADRFEDAS